MKPSISEHIKLLKSDGERLRKTGIAILFSFNRNLFFDSLGNYIRFYNKLKGSLKIRYSKEPGIGESIEKIPDLHFEDYSLSPITQFILIISLPFSFILILLQWNYMKEIKKKIAMGVNQFEAVLNQIKGKVH